MSAKSQHNNILLAIIGFIAVIVIVAFIGFLTLERDDDTIQGEIEVSEYRVSCKLPGRVVEIRVKEGDYVHAGDTLAVLEVPEVDAQRRVAQATGEATKAIQDLTDAGARKEQIQGAFELYQQAMAASEIARKTYTRMQNLYDEGVISGQKRDEAFAAFKATEAQVKAAKSQYDMARNGAREQEKRVVASHVKAAQGAVDVVSSLLKETVQVAQVDGEVSEIYPKVGELVGLGSPIMSISVMKDMWGTFNVREDRLEGLKMGQTFTAFVPAFNKELKLKIYYIKDQGAYAVWKATKANGQYDLKTFEIKARPITPFEGLRPGMSLIIKN
ncbi:HlyD family efflux transporter periplasmic adaptor subunit [Prevotella sp. A2931]|uniref:HlyD family efflux transporter periplasmic adaptor subunit n=1 Tax=Prevotella illustrans TaxID=2800387 RepID=A0ABS3M4I9_9BACT|nr:MULTISPECIES: HlyD family efflux transporter periplasmic adaptor subunit [Prevotella]MBO1363036.1 HlyD family efflux transporter periplasmic adaptor subunit [Prevotella illustrans]PTL25471.1 hemolysin secretion protein D [Prevotella sp. oral taxon 820]